MARNPLDPLSPGVKDAERSGTEPGLGNGPAVSDADLDDVMNDPALSLEERQARLQDLPDRLQAPDAVPVHAEAYAPMDLRIRDALAMLAEGGHSYGMAAPTEAESDDPDAEQVAEDPSRRV